MSHVVNPFLYRIKYTVNFNISVVSKSKYSDFFDYKIKTIYDFIKYFFNKHVMSIKVKTKVNISNLKFYIKSYGICFFLSLKQTKHFFSRQNYNKKLYRNRLLNKKYIKSRKNVICIEKSFFKILSKRYWSVKYKRLTNKKLKKTKRNKLFFFLNRKKSVKNKERKNFILKNRRKIVYKKFKKLKRINKKTFLLLRYIKKKYKKLTLREECDLLLRSLEFPFNPIKKWSINKNKKNVIFSKIYKKSNIYYKHGKNFNPKSKFKQLFLKKKLNLKELGAKYIGSKRFVFLKRQKILSRFLKSKKKCYYKNFWNIKNNSKKYYNYNLNDKNDVSSGSLTALGISWWIELFNLKKNNSSVPIRFFHKRKLKQNICKQKKKIYKLFKVKLNLFKRKYIKTSKKIAASKFKKAKRKKLRCKLMVFKRKYSIPSYFKKYKFLSCYYRSKLLGSYYNSYKRFLDRKVLKRNIKLFKYKNMFFLFKKNIFDKKIYDMDYRKRRKKSFNKTPSWRKRIKNVKKYAKLKKKRNTKKKFIFNLVKNRHSTLYLKKNLNYRKHILLSNKLKQILKSEIFISARAQLKKRTIKNALSRKLKKNVWKLRCIINEAFFNNYKLRLLLKSTNKRLKALIFAKKLYKFLKNWNAKIRIKKFINEFNLFAYKLKKDKFKRITIFLIKCYNVTIKRNVILNIMNYWKKFKSKKKYNIKFKDKRLNYKNLKFFTIKKYNELFKTFKKSKYFIKSKLNKFKKKHVNKRYSKRPFIPRYNLLYKSYFKLFFKNKSVNDFLMIQDKKLKAKSFNMKKRFFFFFNLKYLFFLKNIKLFFIESFNIVFSNRINFVLFFIIKKYWTNIPSAAMFCDAIIIKLLQKSKIGNILRSVLNYLKLFFSKSLIGGYSIFFSGRFSRKDRALFIWKKRGKYSRSNRVSIFDYSSKRVALKYSSCAFKFNIIKTCKRKTTKNLL